MYNKATIKRCDVQINILEYLKKTVKNFPQKIAIIDKEETITFKDLDIKAKKLATSASCGGGVNLSFYRFGKIISSKSINKINDLLLCVA